MRAASILIHALQSQRGHRVPQIAVAFGSGIGVYFALPAEPDAQLLSMIGVLAVLSFLLGWLLRGSFGGIPVFIGLMALGILAGATRTVMVAGPVLDFRYYGAIEGRVVAIDRSASDKMRLTLDAVRLERMGPDATPRRVRISLHGTMVHTPEPGQRIMTTGHLSAPQGPTEPGGFDFQRHSWFLSLGAVGYTRNPVLLAAQSEGTKPVYAFRKRISAALQDRLSGQTGAVAAALAVGDRSGLDQPTLEVLRASNLAHLLAISGLHMGLLAGFVFMSVRGGLSLIPYVALRYPIKVWAAWVALPAAAIYLALSGAAIPTQRAFVMVAVMLLAVIAGRRAFTLRSIGIAALIVLIWQPEALLGPGFQMSFAATVALVLTFRRVSLPRLGVPGWAVPAVSVLVASFVAGAATAPFAAAHFNQFGQYGTLANLLSVPLMGTIIMPALVVAAFLAPFGLEGLPLWAAGLGIDWIIAVAHWIAELDGSVRLIPAPSRWVLPVFAVGAIWCIMWAGHARWLGSAAIAASLVLWVQTPRPVVLISESGGLIGVLTPNGRALSKERGDGFVARSWLENDADMRDQNMAAAGWAPDLAKSYGLATIAGREWQSQAADACAQGLWVVTHRALEGCASIGPDVLRGTGALAILPDGTTITARMYQGNRPWVPRTREPVRVPDMHIAPQKLAAQ